MAEHWYASIILRNVAGYAYINPRPPVEDVDRYAAVLLRTARALKLDVEEAPAPVTPAPKPKDSPGGAEAPVPEDVREPALMNFASGLLGSSKPGLGSLDMSKLIGLTPGIVELLEEAQKQRQTPQSDDHIQAVKERLAQQMPHAADDFSLAVIRRTLAGAFRALLRRARGRS